MFSSTNIIVYAASLLLGITVGLFSKYLIKKKTKNKISEYKKEIFRSHSRILMLEGINDELEKKLKDTSKIPHRISA